MRSDEHADMRQDLAGLSGLTLFNRRRLLVAATLGGAVAIGGTEAIGAESRKSGNAIIGNGGLHHSGLWTRDWDRSMSFYLKALGFSVYISWERAPHRYAFLDSGNGCYVELIENPFFIPTLTPDELLPLSALPPDVANAITASRGPQFHIALRTTRLDAALQHARAEGAKVLWGATDNPQEATTGQGKILMRWCFLEGPSGEWIELLEMPASL